MISENNTLIGHIVEVNGAEFSAQMISDDEGFVPEVTVDQNLLRVGQVGSYLMVRQSGLYLLVIVESMWQEVDPEGGLVRMIRLNPLGEITAKGGFVRGVSHFPTTGAEIDFADWRIINTEVVIVGRMSPMSNGDYSIHPYNELDFYIAFSMIDLHTH